MKLTKGEIYDPKTTVLCGWSAPNHVGGFDAVRPKLEEFIDAEGRYTGPRADGTEPLFRANEKFPQYYSFQFSVMGGDGNWQMISEAKFPAAHLKKAQILAERSKWANDLRAKNPGKQTHVGWQGED
jgi:hypothetical protein